MKTERALLWQLAWPVMMTTGASMSLGVVDMLMVGRLGTTAIASLSVSVTWMFAVGVFGRNISGGVEPLVSQAVGEEQDTIRAGLYQHLLYMMLIVLVPQVFLYSFAEQGLLLLRQEQEIAQLAGQYSSVMALAIPAELLFFYSMRFFQAMEEVKSATLAVLIANVCNVIANYVMIFVLGLGVVGSAWASCISSYVMCFILLWNVRRYILDFLSVRQSFSISTIRKIWSFGWPTGLQISLEVWGFVLSVLFAGWIGTKEQAAHAIVLNISSLCFMLPLGLSVAAATRVGMMVGSQGDWRNAIWTALKATMMIEAVIVFFLFLGAPWWTRLYTDEPELIELSIPLLYLCALFQVFDGLQVVGLGVLRGMGDVRAPLLFHFVAYWLIGIPLSLWLAFELKWGVQGIWSGLAIALAIVAILCIGRILYWMRRGVQSLYAREK